MQKRYSSVLNDKNGKPVSGARVSVRTVANHPNGPLATIYSDNGVTTTPNPLTTNELGYYEYYAADGRYSETIYGPNIKPREITDIQLEDQDTDLNELADSADDTKGDALVAVKLEAPGSIARTQHDRNESLPLRSDFTSESDWESAVAAVSPQLDASQSRFKQSGTGATETTVQEDLRNRPVSAFQFMTAAQIADVKARTQLVDVSSALQTFLNFIVTNQRHGFLPSGDYYCATPLTVGTGSPSTYMGITLEGVGYGAGSRIVIAGSGHTACMTVKKDAWRGLTLKRFTILCDTDAATYGLLFDSSEISQPRTESIFISGPSRAIGLLTGTGSNGEFASFVDCRANNINQFFYCTAGQAYQIYFEGGWANLRGAAPIVFNFDTPAVGGGGMVANGFNASGTQGANGVSNTTLLKTRGARSSTYTFIGGRYEIITCVVDRDAGANNALPACSIEFLGTEITMDNRKGHSDNTINAAVKLHIASGNGMPDLISFDRCRFQGLDAVNTDQVFDVSIPLVYRGTVEFNKCLFLGFAQQPYVVAAWNSDARVVWTRCKAPMVSDNNSTTYSRTPIEFSKSWGGDKFDPGVISARLPNSMGGQLPNGKAINHIQVPQFREAAGSVSNTAADSPWVMGGGTSVFEFIRDWSANSTPGNGPTSPSPWARYVRLNQGSYVYQDISTINLNETNYSPDGQAGKYVCYQALFNRIAGAAGTLKITLENSSSGKIYDEITLAPGGTTVTPMLITLSAVIAATASGSLRLRWEETTNGGDVQIDMAWQFVTTDPQSVFVGASTAAVEGTVPWSGSGESLRVESRLKLPYKADTYGSAASPAHGDLESDIYLSKTTEKLTYYAGSAWNRLPRPRVSADNGDADATLTVLGDEETQIWNTALGADRAVALSTTNAYNGAKFRIVRTANATGAFNLNVGTGPLKALGSAGTWCDVEYNGSAWVLTAYGTL